MIDKELCDKVLTIGTVFNLKGGIAQVLKTYSNSVFPVFKFVGIGSGKNKFSSLWVSIKAITELFFKLCSDHQIRIVHIHTPSYRSFWHTSHYLKLAKLFGKKVILHIHGGGFRDYYYTNPNWIKTILDKSDCVIALTEKWREFFTETVGCHKVEVVNNVIDEPVIKEIKDSNGLLNILFLGFLVDKKGIFDLVDMIAEHKNELNGKILLHIGGSGELDRLNNTINEFHLEELVKYEGWVVSDKKNELLNLCDVFILPSYVEGLPISILEAMSYGKIVIATPVGGIPDLLNDNNGYLIKPGDKDAMFSTVMDIIKNRTSAYNKALQAKASIADNLPENVANKLTKVYNNLLC